MASGKATPAQVKYATDAMSSLAETIRVDDTLGDIVEKTTEIIEARDKVINKDSDSSLAGPQNYVDSMVELDEKAQKLHDVVKINGQFFSEGARDALRKSGSDRSFAFGVAEGMNSLNIGLNEDGEYRLGCDVHGVEMKEGMPGKKNDTVNCTLRYKGFKSKHGMLFPAYVKGCYTQLSKSAYDCVMNEAASAIQRKNNAGRVAPAAASPARKFFKKARTE